MKKDWIEVGKAIKELLTLEFMIDIIEVEK